MNTFLSSVLKFFMIVIDIFNFQHLLHIANALCKTPLQIDFICLGNKEITAFLKCAA